MIVNLYNSDEQHSEKAITINTENLLETNYYFSPLVYIPVESKHEPLDESQLDMHISDSLNTLKDLMSISKNLDEELLKMIKNLKYDR